MNDPTPPPDDDPPGPGDDPLRSLAAEVRVLATTVAESTAAVTAASEAAAEAAVVAREVASSAVADAARIAEKERIDRRVTSRRRLVAAVLVAVLVAVGTFGSFDVYRGDRCRSGNDLRAATLAGYGLAVEATAREFDYPPADARALGERVEATVARDRRLQPVAC